MPGQLAEAIDLEIVPVTPGEPEWNRLVAGSRDGTFCHLLGWRKVMEDAFDCETLYRAAVDQNGTWRGILPLVRVRSRLFGHYLVSMPFLNYGGPLGDATTRNYLCEWAVGEAGRSGADVLELRHRHRATDLSSLVVDSRKVTVLLDLPSDPETLWMDGFPSKLRSQVRRPMKEGMECQFGPDQLEAFYHVFSRNMRDLGTPVLPRAVFESMIRELGDQVVFGTVYHRRTPVAAGCGFLWQGEFEMTWASSLREYNRKSPNMLLYWSFMEEMIRRGAGTFNFGRCTPEGGTHRFKRQWGGEDAPLPWESWSPGERASTPQPDQGMYRHAVAAWQRLPLPIANRLGPVLARRIP